MSGVRTRRAALAIATAAAVGLLATGCSPAASNGSGGSSSSKVTINWYVQPLNSTSIWPDLVAAFNKSHPNIEVTLTVGPTNVDTVRGTLSTQLGSGSATPDVYEGDITWPAQFAKAGLAVNLTKLFPKSFWDRFSPGAITLAQYKGSSYSVPSWTEAAFLYYRKDLLTKAGLPVPSTWEELVADAKKVQATGAVKDGYTWQGAGYEGLTCDFSELVADAGGGIVSSDYTKGTLDSAAGQKALAFLKETIASGVSPKATPTFQEPQSLNDFTAGNALFMRNWSYAWAITQDPKQSKVVGKVGMAPLPSFAGQPTPGASTNGGGGMFINPHSKYLKQDVTFLTWLTGTEAQGMFASVGKVLPANVQAQTPQAQKDVGPVGQVLAKLKIVGRPVGTPAYSQVSRALFQNVNAALSGNASVSGALSSADSQITTALSSSR
ncbi:ABC transporter substrate-binding protein [Amnibacterium sp.]|uniref:ABC transporter substrate-binding protein n=1 Tax=Amnibacterium sp. TaxID=1872496 RepID=UPI002602BE27|nr:ABC transporter substrate-binding protein [Amnibacterium sp.]MCU1472050.1 carbohydrate transporter substrate-binding protein family [Amnibacterium sp.]